MRDPKEVMAVIPECYTGGQQPKVGDVVKTPIGIYLTVVEIREQTKIPDERRWHLFTQGTNHYEAPQECIPDNLELVRRSK